MNDLLELPPYYLDYDEKDQIAAKRNLAIFFMHKQIEEVRALKWKM